VESVKIGIRKEEKWKIMEREKRGMRKEGNGNRGEWGKR
jgi:hypothetical protein